MKRNIVALIVFYTFLLFAVSCKKKGAGDNPNVKLIPKDTVFYSTGLDTMSITSFESFDFIEDLDSSKLPKFRMTVPSRCSIPVPTPGDQRGVSSCAAWAVAYGAMSYYFKVIENKPNYLSTENVFSPSFIYNQLNNGINGNISLDKVLKFAQKNGCCKWSDMGYTQTLTEQPSPTAILNALKYRVDKITRFKLYNVDLMKYHLSLNRPIVVALNVDQDFRASSGIFSNSIHGEKLWKEYTSSSTKLGHAMLIVGYDDDYHAFKVMNSFGPEWGNKGFIWIDYNFLETAIRKVGFFNNKLEMFIPIVFPPSNPYKGLIANYQFNGNINDNGLYSLDGQGYGNTFTTDRKGNSNSAIYFAWGDNAYAKVPTSKYFNDIQADYSISFWMKPDWGGGSTRVMIYRENHFGSIIQYNDGVWGFGATESLGGIQLLKTPLIPPDKWYHVAYTYTANNGLSIFFNDSLYHVAPGERPHFDGNSKDFFIGCANNGTAQQWYPGALDDLYIYNRVLTKDEIHKLYIE